MQEKDYALLQESITELTVKASQMGLDFFSMRYEICPAEVLYSVGSYGMPTRFSHWSFGKAYQRMKMEYDFNLSKIYELVINSDPCYAYLLENNSLLQNKLIVAHVLGHSDFFKNNAYFSSTNRQMVETMSLYASQMKEMEYEHGVKKVEEFVDATFWHLRLMRELDLTEQETIEFARLHSSVIQPSRTGINPYSLGLYLFEALEKKYGRAFIFDVREMENDISFLRNYLTRDLIQDMDLYLYGKKGMPTLSLHMSGRGLKKK